MRKKEIPQALHNAWKVCTSRKKEVALFLSFEVCVRLICLSPLLFLMIREVRLLSLACPLMYALIVFPSRQNAAVCMKNALDGGDIFSPEIISCKNYTHKLLCGIKTCGRILLWGIPLMAVTFFAVYIYFFDAVEGVTDVFSVLRSLSNLGGGTWTGGIIYAALIYFCCVLLLIFGFAFESGTRHAALSSSKKILRGKRGGLIGTYFISLIIFIPMIAAVVTVGKSYIPGIISSISSSSGLPAVSPWQICIIAAALTVTLLLVPFKELTQAAYVDIIDKENDRHAT